MANTAARKSKKDTDIQHKNGGKIATGVVGRRFDSNNGVFIERKIRRIGYIERRGVCKPMYKHNYTILNLRWYKKNMRKYEMCVDIITLLVMSDVIAI